MSGGPKPYHALGYRDFRWLWIAQLVSMTGTQMQTVAINWHVYLLTRSALALGFVGLTRVLPVIVFSLWSGVVADRHDRRLLMLAAQSAMALIAAGLATLTFVRSDSLLWLYALNALSATASAFDNPARQALVPRLVPASHLPGALSFNLTAFHAALIGGPALAGLLIAGIGTGPAAGRGALALVYALNAISFLGVIAVLLAMQTSGKVGGGITAPEPAWDALRLHRLGRAGDACSGRDGGPERARRPRIRLVPLGIAELVPGHALRLKQSNLVDLTAFSGRRHIFLHSSLESNRIL